MSLDDDDGSWTLELESVLLEEECTANDVYAVCKGKSFLEGVRADAWTACLGARTSEDRISTFDDIFDLPNQNSLREDLRIFVGKLGNEEGERFAVTFDLESLLTFYCKTKGVAYSSDNGWLDLLLPLLDLKLPRSETYALFDRLVELYVPRDCRKGGEPFHVFWLLLQYHDPELCSFLDAKRIAPEQYCRIWFSTLFAGSCTLPVIRPIWDLYFQQSDPFFVFFLALIMLVNARDRALSMKTEPKEPIIEFLANMPGALEAEDVADFCSLAQYYSAKTPRSFRCEFAPTLFAQFATGEPEPPKTAMRALCLPVSVGELIEAIDRPRIEGDVRFFLVDCRPADQYNAGHLPTAFHLDCELMLQEPAAFATAVRGLLSAQRQALAAESSAAGEHLCVLGSGRAGEDGDAHMVVASFLKRNVRHVSMLDGGHEAVGEFLTDNFLQEQNTGMLVQSQDSTGRTERLVRKSDSTSANLLSKLSAVMRTKSQEVTGKLIDYIVNPNANPATTVERHVSKHDRNGKRYRDVAPVFSIDEDNDGEIGIDESTPDEDDAEEIVELDERLRSPDVVRHFKCQEVLMNGRMYDSTLAVTDSHLIVFREIEERCGRARIVARRPLSSIVKITAKKRHPELITFKYGNPDGESLVIRDMDRFLIPESDVATRVISNQIIGRS